MPKNYFSSKIFTSLLVCIMLVSLMVVPGVAEEQNTVPAPATVVKQGYMDGNSTNNLGYALVNEYGGLKVTSKNTEHVNFGSTAYKIESTTSGNVLNGYSFLYPGNLWAPGVEPERNAWYYASFYVYVPAPADIQLWTQNNKTVISKTTVPADTWVKLKGLIDLSTDTKAGYNNWKLEISNTTATVAYVDDIVVAQLEEAPDAASLAVSDVDVSTSGAGSLTLTSTIGLDDTSLSASDFTFSSGSVVTDVQLNNTNKEVNVSFEMGYAANDTLTVNVNDVFGRTVTGSFGINKNNNENLFVFKDYMSFETNQSFTYHYRTVEYTTECARTGDRALKVIGDEKDNAALIYFPVDDLKTNTDYCLELYAKTEFDIAVIRLDLNYTTTGSSTGTYTNVSKASKSIPIGTWSRYIVNFSINEDAIDKASLALNILGEYDTYIDDMVLYEGKETIEDKTLISKPFDAISPSAGTAMRTLYVDSKAASGGDGSETAPFSSIEEAKQYIRTINASMTGDIVVYVKGGFYEVGETIEFETADSGTNGYYVIYKPYGDDEVILSGGERVTGWTESEIKGVYKAPLVNDYIRNLYVNDERAKRATYNEFVTPTDWWNDPSNSVSEKDGFVIPNGIIKNHEKAKHLEIYKTIAFRHYWAVGGEAVDNGDTTIIKMPQPTFKLHEIANYQTINWDITDDFRLENALEFLDEPGEWYQDVDTDTLYYMPRIGENIENCEIVAPRVEHVINFVGDTLEDRVENIIIEGFTIAHGAYGRTTRLGRANIQSTCDYTISASTGTQANATNVRGNINIYNARNISLRGNTIKHMSAVGVHIGQGTDNCEVDGNAIYDTSSCAVTVGNSNQPSSTDIESVPLNIRVTNNLIYHVAVEYDADPGIQTYYVNGVEIIGNEISDIPYSAVCVGWGWSDTSNNKQRTVVMHNRIYNFCTHCSDGGAIYSLGNQPDSWIADNYIICNEQDIPGLYHDDGSAGFTDTRNVVRTLDGALDDWFATRYMDHADTVITGNYISQPGFDPQSDMINNNYGNRVIFSDAAMDIIHSAGLGNRYVGLRDRIDSYSAMKETKALHIFTKEKSEQNPASIKTGDTLNLYTVRECINGDMVMLDNSDIRYTVTSPEVLQAEGSLVRAIGSGIGTIIAEDKEGNRAVLVVTVDDAPQKFDVYTSKTSSPKDKLLSVTYRLKTKYWEYVGRPTYDMMSSSDDSVIEIVADGQVRTKNVGTAELYIKGTIGGYPVDTLKGISIYEKGYRVFENLTAAGAVKLDNIKSSFKTPLDELVTEAEFAEILAGYVDLEISDLPHASSDTILTREKMLSYIAQVLVRTFGVSQSGNYELPFFEDRDEVTPSLIADVALAYQYHMFIVEREPVLLEPQREVTVQEAADFLYRFFRLEKCTIVLREDGDFSKYNYDENVIKKPRLANKRSRAYQWALESYSEQKVQMDVSAYQGNLAYKVSDGEAVHEITKTDTSSMAILSFDLKPGKSYKVSFGARMQPYDGKSVTNTLWAQPRIQANSTTKFGWSGNITISSDKWTDVSFTITIPEGQEVKYQQIWVNVYNDKDTNTGYVFELKNISVMEMPSFTSSVAHGEDNAMYPMDEIYLSFPYPVDEASLSTDNFMVTGGATVTSAKLYNESTVCVCMSEILEDSDYTLSVNNLKLQNADTVTDTIFWHTAVKEIKPKEILVYRPSFFVDGVATPIITAGDLDVRIKTKSLLSVDTEVGVYIAQYDEKGNLLDTSKQIATLPAGESESFSLNLKDAQNVKTKIFVWDPETLKPFIEEIQ